MKRFIYKYCYLIPWILYGSIIILPPVFIHPGFLALSAFLLLLAALILEISEFLRDHFREVLRIEENSKLYERHEIQNKLFREFGEF